MRIRKPRGVTRSQFVLVTVLGVFSGVYIWRPMFDDYFGIKRPSVVSIEPETKSE